jgi:pyrroloquinoline quinone (PQQ) biosynthesis protein C
VGKIGRIRWVGELNQALGEGLGNSQWLAEVKADQIGAGKQISLDLWPFIFGLPDNIRSVRDKLPQSLEPAKLFLSNLADEERHFQELYLKQCELAGLCRRILLTSDSELTPATAALLEAMKRACVDGDVVSGVQAVVTAELAATQFARQTQGDFELYFAQHAGQYSPGRIDEGLAWLRLHAKSNTRHALWMNRMLVGLSQEDESLALPPTVQHILQAIFKLWRVDDVVTQRWLGQSHADLQNRCQAK